MIKIMFVMVLASVLQACGTTQATVQTRNEKLQRAEGSQTGSNFAEALQIQNIERWKDDPGKIVNVYVNYPVGSEIVMVIQCQGVPTSSTESLEPNQGTPWNRSSWRVPIDGVDTSTTEMAGRDGTFGDPVWFRQCLGIDGNYHDFPALSDCCFVSSASYTFAPSTIKRDFETEARLIKAEVILRRGGCVNNETLVEQPCPTNNAPEPQTTPDVFATPTGEQ